MDPKTVRRNGRGRPARSGEGAGEHAVLPLVHKHWIVLARGMVAPVLVGGLLLLLLVPAGAGAAAAVVLAGVAAVAAWVWLLWVVATVTVTDERVIIREGVLIRKTKLIPLDRIQDVSTRQNLFGQLLGYGTLEIDTAGRIENEVITYLPSPEWLREQVFALADRFWRDRGPGL